MIKGDALASLLVQRIRSKDPDDVMPPPESHNQLESGEIALLERWVAQGAKYEEHWSFVPPEKAPVPPLAPSSRRYANDPPTVPGQIATVLVTLATLAEKPAASSEGKLMSVPPPAIAFTAPAAAAAAASPSRASASTYASDPGAHIEAQRFVPRDFRRT